MNISYFQVRTSMVKEVVKSKYDHDEPRNFSLFKNYIKMQMEEVDEENQGKNIVTENGTQTELATKGYNFKILPSNKHL